MTERVHFHEELTFSVGMQVVALRDVTTDGGKVLHPKGAVGVVVQSPSDPNNSYRVRFPDGVEESLRREEVTMLARYKEGEIGDASVGASQMNLYDRVIYRCVIGSRAYGLPYIPELIERKQTGSEKQQLTEVDFEFHEKEYERLRVELQEAFESSCLPETPRGGGGVE